MTEGPPLWLILVILGAGLLSVTMLFGPAASEAAPGGRRLIKRARAMGASPTAKARRRAERSLRLASDSRLDLLALRLLPRPEVLRARLAATGRPITLGRYGVACLIVMIAVFAIAELAKAPLPLALLEAVATGLWLPHWAVGFLGAQRKAKFFKHFPETVALMVRGLRAGLPVTETITVVAREVPDPVGEEFRGVADQVRLGVPLEEAMWRAAKRLNLAEFDFLVTSLSVQRETGGNLAETLENLEHIVRRRQQMRLKIKAMSAEATASALIIGSLPFIMTLLMWLVSRQYIVMLFTDPFGRVMIGFGMASLFVGAMVMRKLVKFEV